VGVVTPDHVRLEVALRIPLVVVVVLQEPVVDQVVEEDDLSAVLSLASDHLIAAELLVAAPAVDDLHRTPVGRVPASDWSHLKEKSWRVVSTTNLRLPAK